MGKISISGIEKADCLQTAFLQADGHALVGFYRRLDFVDLD